MATHYCISNPCWICNPGFISQIESSYDYYQNIINYSAISEDKLLNATELLNLIIKDLEP